MIDPDDAETSLNYLRLTASDVGTLTQQARDKAMMLKHVEALLIKSHHLAGVPATVCQSYARAEDRWKEAAQEDAAAAGELAKLDSERDTAKTRIMLFQTMVKDRL